MSEELKACPFCGCTKLDIDDFGFGPAGGKSVIVDYIIQCEECNAMLMQKTKDGTITAWNHRPSPWIPVTPETMPESNLLVLVADSLGTQHGWYEKDNGKWYTDDNAGTQSKEILYPKHYMPIPEIPKP